MSFEKSCSWYYYVDVLSNTISKTAVKIDPFMIILKKLIAGEQKQKKLQTNSSEKCGATDGEKIRSRSRFLLDIFKVTR